jgi:hypothetical protein
VADAPETEPDPEDLALADRLADETARLTARLAFAIAPYTEQERFALAAAPVAVLFHRPPRERMEKPTHRSGRIQPELLPFLVDATRRARERLAYGPDQDNPYLIALVLAAFYVVESVRTGALELGDLARRDPAVAIVPPQRATSDVTAGFGGTTMRVIAPVEGDGGREVTAALELTWPGAA